VRALPLAENKSMGERAGIKTRSRWPRWLAAVCLLLGFFFLFRGLPASDQPGVIGGGLSQFSGTENGTVPFGPQYVTSNIEDLRVGDWVLAHNPELTDEECEAVEEDAEESGPEDWRTVSLRMTKPDGGRLDVTLLRPVEWLGQF